MPRSNPSKYKPEELDPTVRALRLRRLIKLANPGHLDQNWEYVSSGTALLIWLDALLEKRQVLSLEQRDCVFETRILGGILNAGLEADDLFRHADTEFASSFPVVQFIVADGTFVGLSGKDFWVDLRSGKIVAAPPTPPIEAVGYNLMALYLFHAERVLRQRKEGDATG